MHCDVVAPAKSAMANARQSNLVSKEERSAGRRSETGRGTGAIFFPVNGSALCRGLSQSSLRFLSPSQSLSRLDLNIGRGETSSRRTDGESVGDGQNKKKTTCWSGPAQGRRREYRLNPAVRGGDSETRDGHGWVGERGVGVGGMGWWGGVLGFFHYASCSILAGPPKYGKSQIPIVQVRPRLDGTKVGLVRSQRAPLVL